MSKTRCACGRDKSPAYPTCWKCDFDQKLDAAYERGLEDGLRRAATRALSCVRISLLDWRRLATLCHPDRHGGSQAATAAMQWLNEIRPQVLE
jgi:hypothetical protein